MNTKHQPIDHRLVVAIIGMAGAGKSAAAEFFKEKGFTVLRFGAVVDGMFEAEGLLWSPENTKKYREKIREELGMAGVAIKIFPKIQEVLDKENKIILDGLYSWEEYVYLKERLPELQLLCIYARPYIRYERLARRQERPFTLKEARQRDIDEIEIINKAGPIAIADYLIKNETTFEEYKIELERYYSFLML